MRVEHTYVVEKTTPYLKVEDKLIFIGNDEKSIGYTEFIVEYVKSLLTDPKLKAWVQLEYIDALPKGFYRIQVNNRNILDINFQPPRHQTAFVGMLDDIKEALEYKKTMFENWIVVGI